MTREGFREVASSATEPQRIIANYWRFTFLRLLHQKFLTNELSCRARCNLNQFPIYAAIFALSRESTRNSIRD